MFLTTLTKKQQEIFQKLANRIICADHKIDAIEQVQLMNIDKEIGDFYSADTSLVKANLYLLLEEYADKPLTLELFNELKEKFATLNKDSDYAIKFDPQQNIIELFNDSFKICEVFVDESILLKTLSEDFNSKSRQKVILFELLLIACANNNYAQEQQEFMAKIFNSLTLHPLILNSLERIAEQHTTLSQDVAILLDLV